MAEMPVHGVVHRESGNTWVRMKGLLRVWALSCAMMLAGAAIAEAGSKKPRGDAVDLLGVAPNSARLVVAVEDLAGSWDSPAIATTLVTIGSLTDLTATLEAWTLLSKQMGMAPNEAAKRLLGRRFLLVSDGEEAGASWAIAMQVDGDTAGLLRRNLKAVPRSLRAGLPVLAIEGNAFELVVHDLGKRKVSSVFSGDTEPGDAVVVLGPSSRAALFDAVVAAAMSDGRVAGTMDSEKAGWLSKALPDGTDVVVVRHDAEQAWFVLGASIDGHSIRMNFLRQNPDLARARRGGDKPWRLGVFDEAVGDALFAIAEADWLGSPLLPTMGDAFGPGLVDRLELPDEGVFSGRTMLMGYGSETGPLELVGAFETANMTRASIAADRSVSRSLEAMFPGGKFEDFGGLFPQAVRRVDLRPVLHEQNRVLLESLWPQEGPELAWTVRPSTEAGSGEGLGWLVLGLGEERVSAVAEGLGRGGEQAQQGALPWVSVFEVKPRLLVQQLSGQAVAVPAVLASLGAVERVRVQTLMARADLLRGGGVIEFVRPEHGEE